MGEQHWSTQPPPVLLNPTYLPEGGWAPPPTPSSMPVVPTRYPMFWRTPAWSVWRPVLALIVGFGCFLLLQVLAMVVALAIDVATGRIVLKTYLDELSKGRFSVTPVFFLANNVSLGLSIPVVMLISRWLFGQPGRHLASVIGRIRWRLMLGYAAAISLPWLVMTGLDLWWGRAELSVTTDTWLLLVGILLTTPFQAAGEEFLFRGGVMRTFASFVRQPAIGIPIGALVQALLFMAAHGAGDASLNAYYFFFGLVAAWLVWRTGGLEAAIAVHVVNNVTSELSMPFTDISHMFDRQEGAASLADLWPGMVCLVLAVGIAEVFVRRLRPAVVGPEQATRPVLEQAGPRPAL